MEAPADSRSPFHQLPNEILSMIVDFYCLEFMDGGWDTKSLFPDLKTFRLTHRRFADLRSLNEVLFRRVELIPTKAGLALLQGAASPRVVEAVRTVVFVSPPSWAMSFKAWSHFTTLSALKKHSREISVEPGEAEKIRLRMTGSPETVSNQEQYVRELLDDQPIFSDSQLQQGFEWYLRMAEASRALLEDTAGPLRQAWVKLLKSVGDRLYKVCFVIKGCKYDWSRHAAETSLETMPTCRLSPHSHEDDIFDILCHHGAGVAGDSVFATGVACLADSGVAMRKLSIRHSTEGAFDWESLPGWDRLNLSRVEALKFRPFAPSLPDGEQEFLGTVLGWKVTYPCVQGRHAGEAVDSLLAKCRGSLRHLVLHANCDLLWPRREPVSMAALEFLEYVEGDLDPALLARWLPQMPRLRQLYVFLVRFFNRDLVYAPGSWIFLLDAVRDHTSVMGPDAPGMKVHFDSTITQGGRYRNVIRQREGSGDDPVGMPSIDVVNQALHLLDVKKGLDLHLVDRVPLEQNPFISLRPKGRTPNFRGL